MLKKRPMAQARWVDDVDSFLPKKIIETGYANNQPKWPYWVQPLGYPPAEWWNMDQWICETMGESDWSQTGRWVGSDRKYWFRDERDRTMFILRWS
jgi:hypothetical protein